MISKSKILHLPFSLLIFGAHTNMSFIVRENILLLSDRIGPRKYVDYSARSPISSNYMSFWCPFLGPNLTKQHSKYTGVGKMSNRIRSANLRMKVDGDQHFEEF